MPIECPPSDYRGTPNIRLLPAGTPLWRVHPGSRPPCQFRDDPAHPYFGPGRFDAMAPDVFPYLYAAARPATALAERLFRDFGFDEHGDVILPRSLLDGLFLSSLRTTTEFSLVSLVSTADLAAVAQRATLLRVVGHEQAWSRYWAQWLRETVPVAQGLVWMSNRDQPFESVMLFGDRCGPDPLEVCAGPGSRQLDTDDGVEWLNQTMVPYQAVFAV